MMQLFGAERGRPCKSSHGECHIRRRKGGGFGVVLRGLKRRPVATKVRVSVICPTMPERSALHPLVYACFQAQTHEDKELVVFDSGGPPSQFWTSLQDDRVKYIHDPMQYVTVGAKRNRLVKEAQGAIIAMCDDDNLYGPAYLETMVLHLASSGAAVVSLAGFYGVSMYDGSWEYYKNVGGRGETHVFWKHGDLQFDDSVTWGEETRFVDVARDKGLHRVWDDAGIFLHIGHGRNLTAVHPEQHDTIDGDWKATTHGIQCVSFFTCDVILL